MSAKLSTDEAQPAPADAPEWTGEFRQYMVGDPGRAFAAVRPKSDWQTGYQPDTVLDGVVIDAGLELRAASVRGLSHRHAGTVRQDAYAFGTTQDGRYLIAVVSDGVSSGAKSHRAARTVAFRGMKEIDQALTQSPPDQINWRAILERIAAEIALECEQLRLLPPSPEVTWVDIAGQMAATALFAVLEIRPPGEEVPVDVFALGDSAAWILREGEKWESPQAIDKAAGAVATSAVGALPLIPQHLDEPIRTTLRPGDMLMLVSDGIGDPLGDGTGSVGRFLAEKWRRPPALIEFAAQVDFARKSHDDDRTAVAIWPIPAAP